MAPRFIHAVHPSTSSTHPPPTLQQTVTIRDPRCGRCSQDYVLNDNFCRVCGLERGYQDVPASAVHTTI